MFHRSLPASATVRLASRLKSTTTVSKPSPLTVTFPVRSASDDHHLLAAAQHQRVILQRVVEPDALPLGRRDLSR
jgi:hypothetical protein